MIQANELRVGNWVIRENKRYGKVVYVGETIGIENECGGTDRHEKKPIWSSRIKKMKGIPLTKKNLELCGFSERGEYDLFHHPILKCRWVTKEITGSKIKKPFLRFDSTCKPPYTSTDVYFIHQLQNIHFALTFKELEITL